MSEAGSQDLDRRFVTLCLGAAGALGLSTPNPVSAQSAGIEILAGAAAGEGPDQLARAIAEGFGRSHLTPRAVAVNVPRGAEGVAGFADGKRPRAVMMVVGVSTIGAMAVENALGKLKSCRPLARLVGEALPIVVHAESKLGGVPELMAALKTDPGSVTFAGRLYGSADHQLVLLLARAAGVDPAAIRYESNDTSAGAAFSLLNRKVMVATGAMPEFAQQIRGGTFRALAAAASERVPGFDAPTLREQGVEVSLLNWQGVVTRDSVGTALISRFGDALAALTHVEGWRQMLSQRYWADLHQDADAFSRFMEAETMRVAGLLKGVPLRP